MHLSQIHSYAKDGTHWREHVAAPGR